MNVFQLTHEMCGAIEVVRVSGSLDLDSFHRLEKFISTLFQQQHYAVVLDCKELNYISTIALGGLIDLSKKAREHGGDLKLANLVERVYKIINLIGFIKVLQVFSKEEEALASFAKK